MKRLWTKSSGKFCFFNFLGSNFSSELLVLKCTFDNLLRLAKSAPKCWNHAANIIFFTYDISESFKHDDTRKFWCVSASVWMSACMCFHFWRIQRASFNVQILMISNRWAGKLLSDKMSHIRDMRDQNIIFFKKFDVLTIYINFVQCWADIYSSWRQYSSIDV